MSPIRKPTRKKFQPLTLDLRGKLAIVTGATGELGRVITRTLAQCGADVAIHYHKNQSMAARLNRELKDAGRKACIVQADLSVEAEVLKMRDIVNRKFGSPDILVNNAVIQYPWTSVLKQPAADFQSQFQSTVMQNVFMAQAFAPAMIERGHGRIIAINTECAMQCAPNQGAYVSGKRGQDGLLRILAKELGPHGITVNQVAPGWTISDAFRSSSKGGDEGYIAHVPLRRRGEDKEIAYAVAYLASDLAAFVTGVYFPVCGGNVMPSI
jgi:3-oxoacyl-[acyl-carrier protein] reductase